MSVNVALLRGINVGGRARVAMADLRALLEELGFSGVKSLLQSGNLVFESDARQGAEIECLLEAETAKHLGVTVDYFIRSSAEWLQLLARNPFPAEAKRDPAHLVVMCLKDVPKAKDVEALAAAIEGPETLRAVGKQLYVVYPAGIGTSKLTNAAIERKLGLRGTARNWNTVMKLAGLCD